MYCIKCGTKNEAGNEACVKCGEKLSGHHKKSVTIPSTIIIDTRFINKLNKFQKFYVGGAALVLLSSFLPWINFKTPDLGSSVGSLMMGGANAAFKSTSLNVWNLGSFSMLILFYFAPLVFLGYIAYQEIMNKKLIPVYIKSLALAVFCLLTFSLNLTILIASWQLQSVIGTFAKFSGAEAMAGDFFSVGIGVIGGVIGSLLIAWGLLGEIKAIEK
jgi:hypothetical protein